MTNRPHIQRKSVVILRLSDEDSRRTSTSTLGTMFPGTALASCTSGFLLSAICYLLAPFQLPITVY